MTAGGQCEIRWGKKRSGTIPKLDETRERSR